MTKQTNLRYALLAALLLMAAGCAASNGQPVTGATPAVPDVALAPLPAAASLTGTEWTLVSYGAIEASNPVTGTITLKFGNDGQVTGSGGCNSYSAAYNGQGNQLVFRNMISTLKACLADNLTEQEQQYFKALSSVQTFAIAGDELSLWYNTGQGVLKYAKGSG